MNRIDHIYTESALSKYNIKTLKQVEKEHILLVYNQYKHNKGMVARVLGIGRSTLYRKLKEHNIPLNRSPNEQNTQGF